MGIAGCDASVNPVAVRNCSAVGRTGKKPDSPVFLHLLSNFVPSESYSLDSGFCVDNHSRDWEKQ